MSVQNSNLNLGRKGKAGQVDTQSLKGGIKKEQIKDVKKQTIFDIVDKDKNGILTDDEVKNFKDEIATAAKNETLSKREAKKYLKSQDLKEFKGNDLFEFLQEIDSISEKSKIENAEVKRDENGNKYTVLTSDNGNTIETINSDNSSEIETREETGTRTKFYNPSQELEEELFVGNDETTETVQYQQVDGKPVPKTYTTTFKGGNPIQTIECDENGDYKSKTVKDGTTESEYSYTDNDFRLESKIENKGLLAKESKTEYTYNDDGSVTAVKTEFGKKTTTLMKDDKPVSATVEEEGKNTEITYDENGRSEVAIDAEGNTSTTTFNNEDKRLNQTKKVDGNEYSVEYDGNGNTKIILQNGESIDALAKKFGCTKEQLLEANGGKIKGLVGEELVVPGELEADDKRLQGRQTKEEAIAAYKVVADEIAAVKAEAAARKPITFTNKDYDTYEQMAKALFKREGIENPSKRQMQTRIADLKKTNPNIKDGELKGKRIIADVAPEMASRIAGKEKIAKEYKQNLEKRKKAENIAKSFYKIADDNSGYTSMKKMQELLDTQVTKDNITTVLDAYDKEKHGDSSIIDTITSEVMPSGDRGPQKQVLRTIMSKLSDAARQAGVSDKDIEQANQEFEASIKIEYDSLSGAARMTNPKDMEKAIDFLRGAIVAKQTGNVQEMSDEDAIAAFNADFASTDADAQKQYADARKEEGWTAKVGDTVCGWFGCTTIEDMDKKLGKNAADVKRLVAAAGNETEFKKIYKEIFGIDFDKNKIAARDAALGNLQQAQNMSSIINITSGILKKSGSLDYSGLRDEVKNKFQFDDNTVDSVIQSYAQTIGKDASTDDAKKQMLMRFLEETQNNAVTEYQNLTKGKTIEQMNKDLDLLTKSALGTNDIVKDVIQFNENQQTTEMITDAAFEIAGTIALQAVPGLGQIAAARLAVTAARWGTKAVKVINYAKKAEKAFVAVDKFQKANKMSKIGIEMANAGIATATVETSTGKDAKVVMKKTLMNMTFAGVGAGSSMLAPKLMQSFGITNKALANEIAEEIMNAAGSYGVTKVAGDDYGSQDAFIDFATGLIMSRISHVTSNGTSTSSGVRVGDNNGAVKTRPVEDIEPQKVRISKGVKGEVNNYRDPIADGEVARNIDVKHVDAKQRKMVDDALDDVPTPEELAAYQKEIAYKAPTPEEQIALDKHQAQVRKDYKKAHEIGENAVIIENKPVTKNSPSLTTAIENEIKGIDGNINQLKKRIDGAKRFGKNTDKLEQELLALQEKRLAKMAELNPEIPVEIVPETSATVEPVKTEHKKTDTAEVEEVNVLTENETPIVHEEVEIAEIKEPIIQTDAPVVHYPTPEEKMAMGQIGENINRAKTSAEIEKAQQWLNKMPECDQKTRLQNQLNEKLGKLTSEVEVVNVKCANDETINVKKSDSTNEVQDAAKINQKRMQAQKQKLQSLEAKFQQDVITVNIDGRNVKVVRFKGSQEGSNPGFWIKDTKTGELSYMKYSNNSSKMSSEALASDLYNLAGVSTPKLSVVRNSKGENIGVTSKFMDLGTPFAKDIQNIREGFAADCWLANWDALKDGNVMTQNGQAVRSDVGGSLCYRARGGSKGTAFGENVNELTSFFGSNSLSKKYLEGMTKDELINSLNKVTNINDDDIAKLVDKIAGKKSNDGYIAGYKIYGGLNNPEYVKETLIARRNYMKKFQSLCEATPMRQGESIGDYVQRIQNIMPKKTYNISLGLEHAGQPKLSFENIGVSSRVNLGLSADELSSHVLAEHLTPSQKQLINNSCEAFRNSRENRIHHNATNKLTTNNMLHGTNVEYLDSILEKGLVSREFSGESSAHINGVVQDSRTPMCADLWDVQNDMSIDQYFHRSKNEWVDGETNFLPNPHTVPRCGLVIVFNKNAVDPTIMNNSFNVSEGSSIMYKDGNMGGYDSYKSHRAVPVGVPSNAIDRVIVPSYGMSQLGRIKAIIIKSGLDIKIYDTNGNLL